MIEYFSFTSIFQQIQILKKGKNNIYVALIHSDITKADVVTNLSNYYYYIIILRKYVSKNMAQNKLYAKSFCNADKRNICEF